MEELKSILQRVIQFDEEYNTTRLTNSVCEQHIVVDTTFEFEGENYYICQQAKICSDRSLYSINIYINGMETKYDVFFIRSMEVLINKKASGLN